MRRTIRIPSFRLRGVLGALLVGFLAAPAVAGYRDLSREVDAYRPPVLYRAYTTPAPASEEAPAPESADFAEAVERLQEAKAQWEKALTAEPAEDAFYRPDPALWKRLRGASDDAVAAGALGDGFMVDALVTLALVRNPGVHAAERNLQATLERYNQAWNLDEVLRQYSAFTEALMTGVGPMKGREPVAMKFPFPGMLSLKGEIVNQEVRAARAQLAIARRTAVTGARKVYWNLMFTRHAVDVSHDMVDLLKRLESVATTRYEAGETSFQDVIKVRIQRETLEEDLRTRVETQHTAEAKVRELLALAPAVAVGAPAEREPERGVPALEPLYARALEQRQELARMRAMVGKMERMIEMAETRIQPGYSLNLSTYAAEAVNQVGTGRMKEPFAVTTSASMGAGLPKMPWYGSSDAYLRETRQKLAALKDDLSRAESQTVLGVRDAWARLDQAAREEALYAGSVVNLSQAALEVSTRGYETGRVMFADVIASYTNWLMANLARERKRADLGVARAELEAAVGVSPLGR